MKVVTFGEIMLRLAPEGYYRFFQNDRMNASFGGSEANVAVSLANFGAESVFVSKLPAHAIGQGAVDSLRAFGVDTSFIARGGERIGIFLKKARRSAVRSAFTTARIPRSSRRLPPNSTGTRYSTAQTGSIFRASLPRWAPTWRKYAASPALMPKKKGLKYRAT